MDKSAGPTIIKKEEKDSPSKFSLNNAGINVKKEPTDSFFPPTLPKVFGNCLCPKHHLKKKPNEVKIETDNESVASFSTKANLNLNRSFRKKIVFDLIKNEDKEDVRRTFHHKRNHWRRNRKWYYNPYHRNRHNQFRNNNYKYNFNDNQNYRSNRFNNYDNRTFHNRNYFKDIDKSDTESNTDSVESVKVSSTPIKMLYRKLGHTESDKARSSITLDRSFSGSSSSNTDNLDTDNIENINNANRDINVVGFCCMLCEKEKNIEVIDVDDEFSTMLSDIESSSNNNNNNLTDTNDKSNGNKDYHSDKENIDNSSSKINDLNRTRILESDQFSISSSRSSTPNSDIIVMWEAGQSNAADVEICDDLNRSNSNDSWVMIEEA